jgi:hypothetical protein
MGEITALEKLFDEKLNSIHIQLANLNDKADAISIQTTKTNGRVTKLEKWQNMVIGALVITQVILLPIGFKMFFQYVN